MEPDSIDRSSIAITNPPEEIESQNQTAAQESTQNGATKMPIIMSSETVSKGEADAAESPQLTHALEALLGGLEQPAARPEISLGSKDDAVDESMKVDLPGHTKDSEPIEEYETVAPVLQPENDILLASAAAASKSQPFPESTPVIECADIYIEDRPFPQAADIAMGEDSKAVDTLLTEVERQPLSGTSDVDTERESIITGSNSIAIEIQPPSPDQPSNVKTTDMQSGEGLKGAEPMSVVEIQPALQRAPDAVESTDTPMGEVVAGEEGHPEWEVDSSPIESSSEDSSDDSSSEESEEGDNAYKLLSPEEQARILMADGGSDDEGGPVSKGTGGQLRTKNEVPEVVIPKPDVAITPEMPIIELGVVETVVENIALVKARTSGEFRVLESGSVLCLADRSVIGAVAEPLGRVQQPLYSVLFTNAVAIKEAGLSVGTKIFYSELHATYVFTQALKAFKGSDASNLHDEEVGDEEMEFSDDEAEMEHKRRVKQKKSEKYGARMRDGGSSRGGHQLQKQHDVSAGISYDEIEDGPYMPLTRPVGLANSIGHGEAPQEGTYSITNNRDQFRGRGRGDRGRSRGDRGRGRGGFQNRGGAKNGYSQPPQNRPSLSHHNPAQPPFPAAGHSYHQAPQAPPNLYNMSQQYSPSQPLMPPWPQFPPQPPFQQQQQPYQQQPAFQQDFQNTPQISEWPNIQPNIAAGPLAGAFINPAFFGSQSQAGNVNQWNEQGQQNRKGPEGK